MTEDARLDRLVELARLRGGETDDTHDRAERERLLTALGRPPRRRHRSFGARGLAAAFVVALAAAITLFVVLPGDDLAYVVEGGSADHGYVQAIDQEVSLRFSDGTEFVAQPKSAGRVIEVDAAGARVLLEHGTFVVSVVPGLERVFTVAAGPYLVTVTGTEFDLSWDPSRESLALDLREGSVLVRGPMIEDGLRLQAGQRLEARVAEGDVKVRSPSSASNSPSSASHGGAPPNMTPTASPPAAPTAPSERDAPNSPLPALPPSWSRLIAEGAYDQVLAEAEARGVEGVLASGSVGDVVALGDAARYRGRPDLARKALVSLWERFPSKPAGRSAAFLLGRASEGSPGAAITWYDRYLAAEPGGVYASDALGRKLVLLAQHRPAQARAAARAYLAAYPKGAHAAFARELLR